jgi:integrase
MAISDYDVNGEKFYRVYVQARGRTNKKIRLQKVLNKIKTLTAARREEKRFIRELTTNVAKLEGLGLLWSEVIFRWEVAGVNGYLGSRVKRHTIKDHSARVRNHTKVWLNKRASELTRGDGRQILELAKSKGASVSLLKKIKNSVNTIYNWGLEEGIIKSGDRIVNHSPVYGIGVEDKTEKTPPILRLDELRNLLFEAKLQKHPWYAHWAFATLSGMRSGELYALKWEDVDEDNGIIKVTKSYNKRDKILKSTKSGKWRNVNISPQLKEVLLYIKNECPNCDYVLPRIGAWKNGQAGKVLRMFLKRIGINTYVTFHTLRACFATHLLATGAEPMKVMRMGGWSDLKTFQIYIRMAGIDVKGVSDSLDVLPSHSFDNVISIG